MYFYVPVVCTPLLSELHLTPTTGGTVFTIINKETIQEAQAMCCVRARLPSQVWFQSTCPDHSTMVPPHSIGSHHPDLGGVHQ